MMANRPTSCNNSARARDLLQTCLRAQENSQMFSTMYISGFAREDADGAAAELRRLLLEHMRISRLPCNCCEEILLDCSTWAPAHLKGCCIWWRRKISRRIHWGQEEELFHAGGVAYMISPSRRVVDWSGRQPAETGMTGGSSRVLHTYALTKLSEGWVQSIERQCVRLGSSNSAL